MSTDAPGRATGRWTLALVCTAIFMLLLDVTIVSVALGDIQREFRAGLADLQWVLDAYTLPLAGVLLTAATVSDRIGRRRVFLAGLVVFTLGSLACALAWSPLALDVTRAVQGLGGALLFGTALPLLAAAYPDPRRRASAIGVFGATIAAATAVGPLVGGALVAGPGWRWIFLVNVPVGVVALVAGLLRLSESRAAKPRRADWPGTVLLTAGLFAVLYALVRGNVDGWTSATILGCFAAGAVLIAGFVAREATAREPMLDLALFRSRSFTGVVVAVLMMSAGLVGATPYLALYVQNTLGYSAFGSGLRFLPLSVTAFVAAPLVARLGGRAPVRVLVAASLAVTGGGLLALAHLDAGSGWTTLIVGFVLAGIGMGASSAVTSQAAVSAVEPGRAGMATGAVNTMRQVGVAAGVAVLGALFQHRVTDAAVTGDLAGRVPAAQLHAFADAVGGGAGARVAAAVPAPIRAAVAEAARAATASGMNAVLFAGGIATVAAALVALVLIRAPRPAPAAGSGVSAGDESRVTVGS